MADDEKDLLDDWEVIEHGDEKEGYSSVLSEDLKDKIRRTKAKSRRFLNSIAPKGLSRIVEEPLQIQMFGLVSDNEEFGMRSRCSLTGSYVDMAIMEQDPFEDWDFVDVKEEEVEKMESEQLLRFWKMKNGKGLGAAVTAYLVPHSARAATWKALVGVSEKVDLNKEFEQKLEFALSGSGLPTLLSIVPCFGCPIDRVLEDHFGTLKSQDELVTSFKKIMCIFSRSFPEIDLCVGLGDLLGLLLSYLPEADAYGIANEMIKRSGVDRWYFQLNASQCESQLLSFIELLKRHNPKIYEKAFFMSAGQDEGWKMLVRDWFERLFVPTFAPIARARLIDLILLDGVEALYRIALILVGECAEILTNHTDVMVAIDLVNEKLSNLTFTQHLETRIRKIRFVPKKKLDRIHQKTSEQVGVISQDPQIFYNPKPDQPSQIMVRQSHWLSIYSALPMPLRTVDPILLFSGSAHGYMLDNLLRRCRNHDITLFLVRSKRGEIFGGFGTKEWAPSPKAFGTRKNFVFSLVNLKSYSPNITSFLSSDPSAPPPTSGDSSEVSPSDKLVLSAHFYGWELGRTENFQFLDPDGISFGSALRLDHDLNVGWTRHCNTYLSPPLCTQVQFEISDVEVWGFDR